MDKIETEFRDTDECKLSVTLLTLLNAVQNADHDKEFCVGGFAPKIDR